MLRYRANKDIALLLLLLASAIAAGQATPGTEQFSAHMHRAQAYLEQNSPAKAIPELRAAVSINPGDADAQGNLGVLLFFQGNSTEAIPHLRAALEAKPDLAKIQGLLGLAEVRTGRYDDARKDLEVAFPQIAEVPVKVQVGLELVSLYTQAEDLASAVPVLTKLRDSTPDNPEVLYAAYRTYTDLAGEAMLTLSIQAPNSAQMHQMMAHEATRAGKSNDAIAQYRKAIAISPHLPGVHFELAELLHTSQDAGVKEEAEREYQIAYQENPNDARLLSRLGDLESQKGNVEQARSEYSEALKLQPTDADALLGLAKSLIDLDKFDEALPLLQQSIQQEPTNASAHYMLARIYQKQGRTDDAKREVELYKKLKDLKEKLRAEYKDLMIVPSEISADESEPK